MSITEDRAFPAGFESGMSKREFFAAMALKGLLAGGAAGERRNVRTAVELADMLIEELNT